MRTGRLLAHLVLIGAGIVLIVYCDNYVVTPRNIGPEHGIPAAWVGYGLIAASILGQLGVNIFKGSIFDHPSEQEEREFDQYSLNPRRRR